MTIKLLALLPLFGTVWYVYCGDMGMAILCTLFAILNVILLRWCEDD